MDVLHLELTEHFKKRPYILIFFSSCLILFDLQSVVDIYEPVSSQSNSELLATFM